MRSRRELLTRLSLGAAGCAVTAPAAAQTRRATLRAFAAGGDHTVAPWWLLEPLTKGDHLGAGWRITSLSAVQDGAAILGVNHKQHGPLQIHVCANNGSPRGYVYTELFDLIVMDGGHGDKRIGPDFRAVLEHLAQQLMSNELREDNAADIDDVERMMTNEERIRTFGPTPL